MRDLFPKLLELPLFQGISYSEFLEIADRVRLGYSKRKKNAVIVEQDSPCHSLFFVMKGNVAARRESDDHSFALVEDVACPAVLQPEALFGLRTRYTRSYIAQESVQLFEIDKSMLRDVLMLYPTFRINFFNMLSTQVQLRESKLWKKSPDELSERFRSFLLMRVERPAGKKQLLITMDQLAGELNTTRLNVSRMLAELQEKGLIEEKRKRIIIPSFSYFMQNL